MTEKNGCLGDGHTEKDRKITGEMLEELPTLELQDQKIFEYDQGNSLDCTIYSALGACSDLLNNEMTFKTEQFFKNTDLDIKSTVQMIMQYPNNTEEIVKFVACKIKHFAEFEVKMEMLKKEYDQNVMELYAEYMKDGEEK